MKGRFHVPTSHRLRIGPARRFYIGRLLNTGLHGNSPAEVIETIFCAGLQQTVRPEWTRDFVPTTRARRR